MKVLLRPASLATRRVPPPLRLRLRTMASSRKEDKSWTEIAEEAANVAKSLVKKIGSSISEVIPKPKEDNDGGGRLDNRRGDQDAPLYRSPSSPDSIGGLVGGLLGRSLGGIVGSALNAAAEMAAKAAEESRSVYEEAAAAVRSDVRMQDRLGAPIQCAPPTSQSSSSMFVNGKSSKRVQLLFTAIGSRGKAAEVSVTSAEEGGRATGEMEIVARMVPNGEVVRVPSGGGGGGGGRVAGGRSVVDVEWEEKR